MSVTNKPQVDSQPWKIVERCTGKLVQKGYPSYLAAANSIRPNEKSILQAVRA